MSKSIDTRCCNCSYLFIHQVYHNQKTAKGSFSFLVKLPAPAHLSTTHGEDFTLSLFTAKRQAEAINTKLNYSWCEIRRTNLIVHTDITSYNPTSFDKHLNATTTPKWVIISTPSDAGEAKPPSREHSRVSKSTDFIISVKKSRPNVRNFNPWIRLTQPVNLNNYAIGIRYRLHLITSATEKADLNFSQVVPWTRVSRNTNAHMQGWLSNQNSKAKVSWHTNRNSKPD